MSSLSFFQHYGVIFICLVGCISVCKRSGHATDQRCLADPPIQKYTLLRNTLGPYPPTVIESGR
jgi:hypothetical protein